ncbi:Pentatricopeptide repeat-containing protein [Platanthera zijinensis]|uniref:Pentatricopeptide repeat-containing protein n=1 Tax=Platanthera zijinensis TaxID=2320716 RepID=A0AAP0GCH3_9ASPA
MELHSFIQFNRIIPKFSATTRIPIPDSTSQFLKPPSAHHSFSKTPLSTHTFFWNGMLQAHLTSGDPHLAVLAYRDMLLAGVLPDRHSLPRALAASRLSSSFFTGRQIHSHALKLSLSGNSYVLAALMELYAQVAGADAASPLLSQSNPQSSIAYTLLAKLYMLEKNPHSALQIFFHLAASGIELDPVAVATAVKACREMKSAREGKKVHEIARERKLDCDILVANSLLKMYINCGRMEESLALFDSMPSKDVVSWTTIINCNARIGRFNEGLKLFRAMMIGGVKPDEFAVCAVLPACARMAARKSGMEIHGFIIRQRIETTAAVQNALIDMYSKSGSLEIASKVFERMPERDIISWTVLILGYSWHGLGKLGLTLFRQINKDAGAELDGATYSAALHACGTDCIVDEGDNVFKLIGKDNSEPDHLVLMVRILARSGKFGRVQNFLEEHRMERNLDALRAVLDGCRIHSNARMGRRVAEQLIELNPLIAENYVLLSNMCRSNGKCGMVKKMREMIADMGLKPKKACSWIEIRCKVHTFGTGDISHPRSERIYWELRQLMKRMEEEGYVPVEDFNFHDVDEEMECIPYGHSEMLAIAFGLISTLVSNVVRVTKNMRVCRNCHESAKFISRIAGREIVLKDPERFHRFVDGSCSCQDVW